MDEKEYSIVLAEAYGILNNINKEIFEKIPKKLIEFIKENRDKNFPFKYDFSKRLIEQNVKGETKSLITGIYLNYCVNEEEKQRLFGICKENDVKFNEENRNKYNPDNLFKKNDNYESAKMSGDEIVKYSKKNWIVHFFSKFKSWIKK